MTQDKISTGLGEFSKEKFNALITVREITLDSMRETLKKKGYTEVTTSSLVNIAGSCENPNASFTLNYYGREAHLSQSAQLQLEALVIILNKPVFTVNNSFREENYDDPEAQGRRLSEFTLIEAERSYENENPIYIVDNIIKEETSMVKRTVSEVLDECSREIEILGGDINYLERIASLSPLNFARIGYTDVIDFLNQNGKKYKIGDDLGIAEERRILKQWNSPVFITGYPHNIKFFNIKRPKWNNEGTFSVDLLLPKLGETIGGAVREENGEIIKKQLLESKIATYLTSKGQDPLELFTEYFRLFEQEKPILRGGYGIGFERFIGFLLGSNDILETISYRTLQPGAKR